MKKYTFLLCLTLLLLIATGANAQRIRVIYFQPLDVPKPTDKTLNNVRNIMLNVQEFYKKEMDRHGYGNKTFNIESDVNNKPVIHVIAGKRNLKAYTNNVVIEKELPNHLRDRFALKNNIRVTFLGGSKIIGGGALTYITCRDKTCAYDVLVPAESGALMPQFTAHELGHAFGLQHHPALGKDNFVMETLVFLNRIPRLADSQIDDFEARWLDKHKYFNQRNEINNPPEISKVHGLTAAIIEGKQHVQFRIDLNSDIALHQAQISKSNSGIVLGWNELQNKAETTDFVVRRNDLLGVKSVLFQVMDTQGNKNRQTLQITLPAKAEEPEEPDEDPRNVVAIGRVLTSWAKLKR